MTRILVSGASGFIGKPLVSFLSSIGFSVFQLVRPSANPPSCSISWDPESGKASREDFEDFEAIIHLAGEPLTLSRWSVRKREKILQSRTVGTMFLSHLLSKVRTPPKVFISASAIGYYGDRGEEILNEESAPGVGFLSTVCTRWEKGAFELQARGTRVVQTRFGVVLGSDGGALQKMLSAYRLGLGGKLGSGRQWMSWIHRDDLIRAIVHMIHAKSLEGPVNVVSPYPVRQEDFSSTLAHLLHRPHFLRIPAWILRFTLGMMAEEMILASTRVECTKLLASKFSFNYPDLRSALVQALQI